MPDDLDGFVAWDELGDVTRELAALVRAHAANRTAGASPRTVAGIWTDAQVLRTQNAGSAVATRLRL